MFGNYIYLILIIVSLFDFKCLHAQEVISSSGKDYSNSNGSISFTLGEPVIKTLDDQPNSTDEYSTQGFEQPIDLTTHLTDYYCGSETSPYQLSSTTENFEIHEIGRATCLYKYEWKITNETTGAIAYALTSSTNSNRHKMNLNYVTSNGSSDEWPNNSSSPPSGFLTNSTIYSIQVRAKFKNSGGCGGALTEYGRKCYVETPGLPTTELSNCGTSSNPTQIASFTDNIYCDPVTSGEVYRYIFKIEDQDPNNPLPTVTEINKYNYFTLSEVLRNQIGKTYKVTVTAWMRFTNSSDCPEGDECFILSPASGATTDLSNCGTLSNPISYGLNDQIYCDPVTGIYRYKFVIVDQSANPVPTVTHKSMQNYFTLSSLGLNYTGKTYAVTVYSWMRKTSESDASPGTTCYVSSPNNGPTVQLIPSQCGSSVTPIEVSSGDVLEAVIDPPISSSFEYKYIFHFFDNSNALIKTCTTAHNNNRRKICLNNCPTGITSANIYPSIGDKIKVVSEAWVKNSYSPATAPNILPSGGDCFIEYSTAKSMMADNNSGLTLNLFPNPNNGSAFYINAYGFNDSDDEIIISLMDLHGKQVYIEHTGSSANQIIKEVLLQEKLADGIYLAKVEKGSYSVIQKLIIH